MTTRYDALGRKIGTIDELGHETVLGYDRANHLTSTKHMLSTELYAYDELGHRKQQTITYTVFNTATGSTITKTLNTDYLLDTRGLILKTILPAKDQTGAPTVRDQLTIDRYDYAGRKVAEINANGDTAYWTYTANGKLATHTDLGGQVSTYTYDANAGYLAGIKSRRPDTTAGAPAGSMVDARDIRYEYDTAGQLRRIVDAGANQITEYAYDAMGRHVRESLTQGNIVIRDTRIGYDALGRMNKVSDPGQYTRYSFDANGNRRRGLTQYVDNGGAVRMVDNWYTYDRENRITLTQGELVDLKNAQGVVTGQQIQITTRQGQQLAYDTHGNRRSATGMASGSAVTEFYTFDDDNRLIGTYKNGLMASGRAYDGAGRMTDYITYTAAGAIDSRRENLYFESAPGTGRFGAGSYRPQGRCEAPQARAGATTAG